MPIVAVGLVLAFSSGFAINAGFVVLGTFLFNIGISLALSGSLSFVTGLFQHAPTAVTSRGRTVSARQPIAAWRVIYGHVRTGGIYTFIDSRGATKQFLDLVLTLAGHQLQSIGTMYFDGVAVPLDSSGNGTGKYAGFVRVRKNLGTAAQTAIADLVAANPKWTVNHRQRGRAHVWVELTWSADVFPNGVPTITFDVEGALVYDPRSALTAYSTNLALCIRDYMTSTSYGLGAPSTDIDDTAFSTAANLCDEDVALRAGGTEKRYTCNGVFDTTVQFGNALKALLSACAGDLTCPGGQWALYPAAWRPPVTLADGRASYTEDDLRGPIEFNPRTPHRDIFNGVKGIFVCTENKDQQSDFPGVTDPAYVTEDNGEVLWKDIELPFTNSGATAQRIAKIILGTARSQGRVKLAFRLTGFQSAPPDVIPMTSARFGWSAKAFKLTDFQFVNYAAEDGSPLLGVDLFGRETAASIYDWNAAVDEKVANAPSSSAEPPTSDNVAAPTNLIITDALIGPVGARQPVMNLSWTAPLDSTVTSGGKIDIQFKPHSGSLWTGAGQVDGAATQASISDIDPGATYDVRIRSVSAGFVASNWLEVDNHSVPL